MDYPGRIKELVRTIRKEGRISAEAAAEFDSLIEDGGWVYTVLCFEHPLPKPVDGVASLKDFPRRHAICEYEAGDGRFFPVYTSGDYALNFAEKIKFPDFPFPYVPRITMKELLEWVRETGLSGIIVNPQAEAVTLSV